MSYASLRDLYRELQSCQRRLGTVGESSDDFDRVLRLAHEINNRLTTELLHVGDAPGEMQRVTRQLLQGSTQK